VFGDDPTTLPQPASGAFPDPETIVGAGFAVLLPSLPIPPNAEPAEGVAAQILQVVDAIDDPQIDIRRPALWGHSFGGYGVLVAATQSPRFAAVVSAAPLPDLITAYQQTALYPRVIPDAGYPIAAGAGWAETGQARMGAPAWDDPQGYLRNSPYFQVKAITAPVLLVTSDLDGDPVGARAMFNALYRLGKDAVILDYFGEGHVLFSPGNLRDVYERTFAFLRQTLSRPPQSVSPASLPTPAPRPPGRPPA